MPRSTLPVALAGFLGVALNLVAVASLREVPHTYAPGDVPAWRSETLAHPSASTVSALSFTFGLVFLAAFVGGLATIIRSSWATVGAVLFGSGALLDAAGTMAPVAVLHVGADSGVALLWVTLLLDSAFNGLLGLGLICFAVGWTGAPRWLRWLGLVAGIASLPVALQFSDDFFARLLAIAGPLWLSWVVAVSIRLILTGPLPDPLPSGGEGDSSSSP
ncbi:MAG: hypothetical protein QM817_05020 [Archangium sp.]